MYLLKNYFLSVGPFDISTESFLSLLSFHPKFSLSFSFPLCSLCSLFSLCSFGGWVCRRGLGSSVVVGSSVVGVAGVGLVLRWWLVDSVGGLIRWVG